MPPALPTGQRYVPVEPAPPLPAPGSLASVPDPAPEAIAPTAPFPTASGTSLSPPPSAYYPGAGPTVEGFLYGQLGKAVFPGSLNTWTAVQTYQITDAGTGADSPSLRPTAAFWDHITTATPVPGIGMAHTFRCQNTTPALVEIAKICSEITGVTPGSEEGTIAFCVIHQGQMCEVGRLRGQLGKDATADATGVYGFLGGEWFMRTYLRVQERFGMNGVTPVGVRTLAAAATDAGTTQTLANSLRQALIDFGLGQ